MFFYSHYLLPSDFLHRYIYLWINYAVFEELEANNIVRSREVYKQCLTVIPHSKFTFAKIWVMAAEFEVRQRDLHAARKLLGRAVGQAPNERVFRAYIDIERKLGNIDRCRILFEKLLEHFPSNCNAWVDFARLEMSLDEADRVRGLLELAIEQPLLDMPEIVWRAYIDFEIEEEEHDRVRELYNRLLERTKHVNVWISFAQFEHTAGYVSSTAQLRDYSFTILYVTYLIFYFCSNVENARTILREANKELKDSKMNEERALLVKAWLELEEQVGDKERIAEVKTMVPEKVKKRRRVEEGMEEYWEYVFGDEQKEQPNLRLLQRAKMWKQKQKQAGGDAEN